jgi:hypothetical protein
MDANVNERIRELAEQANMTFNGTDLSGSIGRVQCYEDELEKFAELIVNECARIVTNNGIATATHDQMVRQDCVNEIKLHFGVEQ